MLSITSASNGSVFHSLRLPGGTTSVCPAKTTSGFFVPRLNQMLDTFSKFRLTQSKSKSFSSFFMYS